MSRKEELQRILAGLESDSKEIMNEIDAALAELEALREELGDNNDTIEQVSRFINEGGEVNGEDTDR